MVNKDLARKNGVVQELYMISNDFDNQSDAVGYAIIGNIHENPELLEGV